MTFLLNHVIMFQMPKNGQNGTLADDINVVMRLRGDFEMLFY